MISSRYEWVGRLPGLPKLVLEGLKLGAFNTKEIPGKGSNPVIMQLAEEAGVKKIYADDDVAWCAVAMCALLLRAGKKIDFTGYDRLRAKSFEKYGTKVTTPQLGDLLVFTRDGGGHVGIYIAEDSTHFHVMGGNQGNEFNISRIAKNRLSAARRPSYSIGTPAAVKQYKVKPEGAITTNEA